MGRTLRRRRVIEIRKLGSEDLAGFRALHRLPLSKVRQKTPRGRIPRSPRRWRAAKFGVRFGFRDAGRVPEG